MTDKSASLQGVKWSRNLRCDLYVLSLCLSSLDLKPSIFSVRGTLVIMFVPSSSCSSPSCSFLSFKTLSSSPDREETLTEANRVKLIQKQRMMLESKRHRQPQVMATVSRYCCCCCCFRRRRRRRRRWTPDCYSVSFVFVSFPLHQLLSVVALLYSFS